MAHKLNKSATRKQFLLAGIAGMVLAFLLSLLLYIVNPFFSSLAFLSPEQLGSTMGATLFLLLLGFIVMAEWPMMLFVLARLARQGVSAFLMNGTHLAYTLFPALYGVLGALLTGQNWWLGLMALSSLLRLSTSLLINPREMAEYHAAKAVAKEENTISNTDFNTSSPFKKLGNTALNQIKGFILDMDGVLYRGNKVRVGARDFIEYLNEERIPYACLTNNSSRNQAMYQEKLDKLRLPINAECVVGSGFATAEWLVQEAAPGARVLVIGEAGLRHELSSRGFTLVEKPPADYVIVGIDFNFTYERLKQAALAIRQNAKFIGTNADPSYPSEEGLVPGNGSILAFLETATDVKPIIIGKPQPAIMEIALAKLELPHEQVAIVGDRLNTDILGGQQAGMITILLRGGVTSDAERIASPIKPDHVFHDLEDLLDFYQKER
jgi:4-nitrophenyl phosphatase